MSMGAPMNSSVVNSNLKSNGTIINLPRTQADEKPKQRAAPRVRASGKYGAKNEKEANRPARPNFAKRKESMNAIVEKNKQMHIQI